MRKESHIRYKKVVRSRDISPENSMIFKSRNNSLSKLESSDFLNSFTEIKLPKPENQNLAASFSTPCLAQEKDYDLTAFKLLPSLRKKNLPISYVSVSHAQEFTSKFNFKPKKVLKDVNTGKKMILSKNRNETKSCLLQVPSDERNDASKSALRILSPSESSSKDHEELDKAIKRTLVIKHSKELSLCLFDPVVDPLSPKSLLESKKISENIEVIGHSKWFLSDGSFIWKDCVVQGYSEENEKFLISWPGGNTKHVSRINLRFDDEDQQNFERRIVGAKKNRDETEKNLYNQLVLMNTEASFNILPTRVITVILEYVQCCNKTSISNYWNPWVYYSIPLNILFNPKRFLWKNSKTHFVDETLIYRSKGLHNHSEYFQQFLEQIRPIKLFQYKGKGNVSAKSVNNLIFDVQGHWNFACKLIDFTTKEETKKKQRITQRTKTNIKDQAKVSHEGEEIPQARLGMSRFLALLNRASDKILISDPVRNKISQEVSSILLSWDSLRLFPHYIGKPLYKDHLLKSYEQKIIEFTKEVQDVLFDIQFEIQNLLTVEDEKRNERNKLKLKARAYSKQVVELEESLPYDLIMKYTRFIKLNNTKLENALLKCILLSLDEFNDSLFAPIANVYTHLSTEKALVKETIDLASNPGKCLVKISLDVDLQKKKVKLDLSAHSFCMELLNLIVSAVQNIEKLNCLATNQTGGARPDMLLKVSNNASAKLSKRFTALTDNLDKQFKLLKAYFSNVEEFNFVISIRPSVYVKDYEGIIDIDKIKDEISKLEKISRKIRELIGEGYKEIGVWSIDGNSVKVVMLDIINHTIEKLMKIIIDNCVTKAGTIREAFLEVKAIISHNPSNIEELDEIRIFINEQFDTKMNFIDSETKKLMGYIHTLEGYKAYLSYDLYKESWKCLGFSKALNTQKTTCLRSFVVLIESFTKQLVDQNTRLLEDITSMRNKLEILKLESNIEMQETVSLDFRVIEQGIQVAAEKAEIIKSREEILKKNPTNFKILDDLNREFKPYCNLWYYIREFIEKYPSWMNGPISLLPREEIGNRLTFVINEISKMERAIFKNEPPALKLCKDFAVEINNFKPYLPVLKCVNNPGMKDRHWVEFSQQSGLEFLRSQSISLKTLINCGIMSHLEQLELVSELATKEHNLENAKRKMEAEWTQIIFELLPYKGSYILVNTENLWDVLNEHLMRTIAMTASPYIQFILSEITQWNSNLLKIQNILEAWESFQKNWQYLQPIFTNHDISKQLSQAASKFRNVNSQWENIMNSVKSNPVVYDFCIAHSKLLDTLTTGNETLDSIFKSLSEYLMLKRRAFPRFYFLSNEEFITMLSNSRDIITIQKYIVKCFEAIAGVMTNTQNIIGMVSSEGEKVAFECPVSLYVDNEIKSIEIWMVDLEKEMFSSLAKQLVKALQTYNEHQLESWVKTWASQLIHASIMALWTNGVEEAISGNALPQLLESGRARLNSIVDQVRRDLQPLDRLTFSTLVVLDVHNQDIIQLLISKGAIDTNDFSWFCNMRYYLVEGEMIVRMLDCAREYGYEYLGNTGRLVITELTDRCYRTLMSALNMSLGGAPEGPAGTGKTETTKDLAKSLAKKCVVFNCSDRLDHIYMAKFFTGLCYCGAWACFDEFNRIELDVLSVIAEQILSIQTAVQKKARFMSLDEEMVKLNPTCAVFITMNPDYGGRSRLPDNLKALFRPVAMMVPDYAMIAEIYLYSYGFTSARLLARKITNSLKLASEQLSTQHHYDYGMRAVSTIIKAAGWLKQNNPKGDEELVVLEAIQSTNIPKFLSQDIPLFTGIIKDLFPDADSRQKIDSEFLNAISNTMIDSLLVENERFIMKIFEIYVTIQTRHGLMIVGESMSGKSTAIQILSRTLSSKSQVSVCHINPKSMNLAQLYGAPDPNSQDWKDGIMGQAIRLFCESSSKGYKWIVLDGPVDPLWIENLNTVLDDNKKLCLTSGEIIKLNETIRLMFEVDDLSSASPATISRCGMIYMDAEDVIGPKTLIKQWIAYPPMAFTTPRYKILFASLFDEIFLPVLEYWRKDIQGKKLACCTLSHASRNMINLFQALIIKKGKSRKQHDQDVIESNNTNVLVKVDTLNEETFQSLSRQKTIGIVTKEALVQEIEKISKAEDTQKEDERVRNLFIFAVQWSLAGTCNEEGKILCSNFLYSVVKDMAKIPEKIYKFYFEENEKTWVKWKNLLSVPQKTADITSILVPTTSLESYKYFLHQIVSRKINVIIAGETGTGKTLLIKSILPDLDKTFQIYSTMFSVRSDASDVQSFIESSVSKRRKGFFGPVFGNFTIFMIDDMGMPSKEVYGAQSAIELLRTAAERGEIFDRDTLELKILEDVQYLGTMGSIIDRRQVISSRFLSHFFFLNFANYNSDSLFLIVNTLLTLGFSSYVPEILSSVSSLSKGIIKVYSETLNTLPPTPTKSHYAFNLRDLASFLKGLLLVPPQRLNDTGTLWRLWVHECFRVFSDRLVDEHDRASLLKIINGSLTENYNVKWEDLVTSEPVFCNYINDKSYQECTGQDILRNRLKEFLHDYNLDFPNEKMNLFFFDYAIKHINRISRVLAWNSGNLLLIGVSGSGRNSLTRLCAYMSDMKVMSIKLTKSYGLEEWREDLKQVLIAAGKINKPVVFLLKDNEIVQESFLGDINNILNTGISPNLFTAEEIQGINESLKMNRNYMPLTDQQRWEAFIGNVQRCLHIVLCMFPHGEVMRHRIRQFPSLANCCTIDWFTDWPSEALEVIAEHFLKTEVIRDSPEKLTPAVNICVYFHETVGRISKDYLQEYKRYNYVTPSHYLLLLKILKKLYALKEDTTVKQTKKYAIGVQQLDSTQHHVQKLRGELMALKPILEQKTILAQETLRQVQKENADADVTRSMVASEQISSQEQAAIAEKIKQECQQALAIALPELESAIKALDTIKKDDIDLVRTMHNPPEAVRLTLEALAIVNKLKPVRVKGSDSQSAVTYDYYESGKKMLSIPKFINKLKKFDRESLEEETISKIAPYMDLPKFQPEIVNYASSAAQGLCKWVRAMFVYYHVNKEVLPKKASLKIAKADLGEKMRVLKIKQDELRKVEDYIAELQSKLELQVAETKALSDEINRVELQMDRAVKLIDQLGGERESWTNKVHQFSTDMDNLLGDVLVAAGVITYMGPFTWAYREVCMDKNWIPFMNSTGAISCSKTFNLASVIGDPVKLQKWKLSGLPSDKVSIENAIILKHCLNFPLIIDPQGQAIRWLRKKLAHIRTPLNRTKMDNNDFLSKLENSLFIGANLLVEDIKETIDPVLDPILLNQFYIQESEKLIKITEIPWHYDDNFYLYMFCNNSNPHFSAEISNKVTLLNFIITEEGLGEQMLDLVCRKEMPKETEERSKLILQSVEHVRNMQALEDKILELLKSGGSNILESEELINSLTDSKIMALEVEKKLTNVKAAEQRITIIQGNYRPAAKLSAVLYFAIADLANIEIMYQYSMTWFLVVFKKALSLAEKAKDVSERVKNITLKFRELIYQGMYDSLQDRDRILFVFLISIRVLMHEKHVQPWQLRYFLTGVCGIAKLKPNPTGFLSDKLWRDLCQLDLQVKGLCEHIEGNQETWERFVTTDIQWVHLPTFDEFSQNLPDPYHSVTWIARLLIVRAIKPESLGVAVKAFVKSVLGEVYLYPKVFSLPGTIAETSALKPLIFILSSGNDPQSLIKRYTNEIGVTLRTASLGKGQGDKAAKIIREASTLGYWVLLQNCHLAISWLQTLELILEEFSAANENGEAINENFRLILTATPSEGFPSGLLQKSVKVRAQSPGGLCNNLLGIYSAITDSKEEIAFYESSNKPDLWKKLYFGLSFFHCVIKERKFFGPVGWNILYEFNESDLRISSRQLMEMINEFEKPSFEALIHITANCNYGGRVTDSWDFRTLQELLLSFYNPEILESAGGKITVMPGYSISVESSLEEITAQIRGFPQVQSPEVFGLHPNAELSRSRTEGYSLCSRLLALQPGGLSVSFQEQRNNILSIADLILAKITGTFDIQSASEKFPLNYYDSMNTVLVQELGRYNKLVELVVSSLDILIKSYEGSVLITAEYEVLGESLMENSVPVMWKNNSYASCKSLVSWVEDLRKRLDFFQEWIDRGRPTVFWISGFYFTQSFLTVTLQEHARKTKLPIDTLTFSFDVLDHEPTATPSFGVYIKGLYLEGASWQGGALDECRPRELYCQFPIVRNN